jgi:hypothetical protein
MRGLTILAAILALPVLGSGCQKAPAVAARWSIHDLSSAGTSPLPAELRLDPSRAVARRLGTETVLAKQAEAGGAVIRDSWIKNVRDGHGQVVYADGRVHDAVPAVVLARARAAAQRKESALARLKRELPDMAAAPWVQGPRLELSQDGRLRGWRLGWVVDYLDAQNDQFWQARATLAGKVVDKRLVGSSHVTAPASVYPKGPKASELEEVLLNGLLEDKGLASARTQVTCSDEQALLQWQPGERSYRYPPQDLRFDAVQAYYYVDRAQAWLKEQAGFELPFSLTVDVFAGGVESPRNTACYYYGVIRLGAGDGKTYRHLMRDPSVVMHEVSHAVIEVISHLPTQEEGGSLNEAFADYLAASMLGSPRMGEASYVPAPYKRSLDNRMTLAEKDGGLYHDSLIVSGALWEMRAALGPAKGLALGLKILARLNVDSGFETFKTACLDAIQDGFSTQEAGAVVEILEKRGWGDLSHGRDKPAPTPSPRANGLWAANTKGE